MEGTTFSIHSASRPEAMADVPGVCELPLTRAVVHYRDLHEVDPPGGRIQDIGLALVLEGRFASSAEADFLFRHFYSSCQISAYLCSANIPQHFANSVGVFNRTFTVYFLLFHEVVFKVFVSFWRGFFFVV